MARICSQPFNSLLFKYSNRFAKHGSQPMFISLHRLPSKSTRGLPPPPQSLQLVCCCCFCLVVFCLNAKVIPTLPPETVTTSNPPKTFFPDCQTLKSVDRLQNIKFAICPSFYQVQSNSNLYNISYFTVPRYLKRLYFHKSLLTKVNFH